MKHVNSSQLQKREGAEEINDLMLSSPGVPLWKVLDVASLGKSVPLTMRPLDVRMCLTDIPTPDWMDVLLVVPSQFGLG